MSNLGCVIPAATLGQEREMLTLPVIDQGPGMLRTLTAASGPRCAEPGRVHLADALVGGPAGGAGAGLALADELPALTGHSAPVIQGAEVTRS